MALNIKLPIFEGPLDLLLHLIKKSKIDIYNIPICEITTQYISYLKQMKELDLDIASEFILMAATLIEIKSKLLLPNRPSEDTTEEKDPRKQLVEKLIEYKKYKELSGMLKEIEDNNELYFKSAEIIDDTVQSKNTVLDNITLDALMNSFKNIMNEYKDRFNKRGIIPENINYDQYRIEDKINYISERLKETDRISFNEFFKSASCRIELIVIFLAMLEMIKLRTIYVVQQNNFDNILIERHEV